MDADLSLPGLDSNQEPIGALPEPIPFPQRRPTSTTRPAVTRPVVNIRARRNAS
jgi:hypothetical protein